MVSGPMATKKMIPVVNHREGDGCDADDDQTADGAMPEYARGAGKLAVARQADQADAHDGPERASRSGITSIGAIIHHERMRSISSR